MSGYVLCVWLHVVAAAVWVGSMVFFAAAIVPVLRSIDARQAAPALLERIGARFRVIGGVSLGVLLVTGTANLHYRGIGWSTMSNPAFSAGGFGRVLAWKLGLVALVVLMTGAHEVRGAIAELADIVLADAGDNAGLRDVA
ncbi:hypothetical protein AKJ09_08055 [Labilithrix luteola]|uniref:TMEM205-like domain-containing protein n=1 Tax=Labilithrix luteola TaxID=1391654 RepID=A0A0K1Q6W3_9BACT|nr:DUF4149 domain-containing protein [Labilithrix luteola]AKV01392.1 hypothetical protein AKJ09_08055 [Labilithrix luteola]